MNQLMRYLPSALLIVMSTALLPGCDEPTPPPFVEDPTDQPSDAPPAQPERPTTQEILSGPFRDLPLEVVPFVARVPQSWEIKTFGTTTPVTMLIGPAPSGDVKIQLASQPTISPGHMERLLDAIKERSDNSDAEEIQVGTRGPLRFIERRIVGSPITIPWFNPQGQLEERQIVPMRWKFTLFVPEDQNVRVYDFNFIDLTQEQYDADEIFLRSIIDNLRHQAPLPSDQPLVH